MVNSYSQDTVRTTNILLNQSYETKNQLIVQLEKQLPSVLAAPVNDNCANATVLVVNAPCTGGTTSGGGTTTIKTTYSLVDIKPYDGLSYYRLKQTDMNGNTKMFNIIAVTRNNSNIKVIKITNVLGQEVSEESEGIKIYYFNDGSVMKRVSK